MANSVIKQLLTNQLLAYLPEELVREFKNFAFIDMQSHTNKRMKDVVNHQINNAYISTHTMMVEEETAEPYLGDIWYDPDNDPWNNDNDPADNNDNWDADNRNVAHWAFCISEDCSQQYQCLFCTYCGNYIDGYIQNADILRIKGLDDIPYPEQILCKC